MEKKTASSRNVAGKLDNCWRKTETKSMPVTLHKYQLKVN
jgi:hypothetical protein